MPISIFHKKILFKIINFKMEKISQNFNSFDEKILYVLEDEYFHNEIKKENCKYK